MTFTINVLEERIRLLKADLATRDKLGTDRAWLEARIRELNEAIKVLEAR